MAEASEAPPMLSEQSAAATEVYNNVKVSLADLSAKGNSNYAKKNYTEAADYYARASELQAELNGEMSPENAEILFLYGRSLFKVGQGKSDVLGGRAGGEKKKSPNGAAKSKAPPTASEPADTVDEVAEEGVALAADKNGAEVKQEDGAAPKKPLFHFTGDENFEDSDDEDVEANEDEGEEEDEDDLAAAFEVLDLARVLFTRKLEEPEEGAGKGKEVGDSLMTKHIKERLADTHDLLAEISLENERFPNAVSDFKVALTYKDELYPLESEIIAEAHFKLSLALEFASITTTEDEEGDVAENPKDTHVDEAMREEAAKELELAIKSTNLKLQSKEVELASTFSVDDNDITISQIAEVKEIIADMEQRLLDLRAPPIDVNAALHGPAGAADGINPMGGILGATLGESPAEAQARIDEAKRTATDLTGLVRRKKAPKTGDDGDEDEHTATNGNGAVATKRKANELESDDAAVVTKLEEEDEEEGKAAKKVKVQETPDEA
ncbi:MAG: hypothetical protein M1818_005996 [Claussenomyces sp. TS43310]|nr:MAG: hypothetical protein M1818_005996 [Claussenomyces sp. TS43310]